LICINAARRPQGTVCNMPAPKYSTTPPVPARVRIELTAPSGDMDPAFLLRLLAQLRSLGVREIGLSCPGEPFLFGWLPEAIGHAKRDLGFESVFLTTNGRTATPERVRECIEAGLDSLEFGLEANLEAAREVRDEVEARTGHHCAIVASTRCGAKPVRRPNRPCPSLFTEAAIGYDGRVSACPYDHDRRFAMGSLECETFLECWHDERFQRLREAHLANDLRGTPCQGCTARGA